MLHELYHLKLICDARENDENYLFTSDSKQENEFRSSLTKYRQKLLNKGVREQQVENLLLSLFHGINTQVYNAAIDLFIEDLIYTKHPEAHPIQFLSLYNLVTKGIEATTGDKIVNDLPGHLISKSKILNLVTALHFKDLYGVDLLSDFNANKIEMNQAESFYEEFKEYQNDKAPGEEYELIQHWAEDLKIDRYFKLVKEQTTVNSTADDILDEINSDPLWHK